MGKFLGLVGVAGAGAVAVGLYVGGVFAPEATGGGDAAATLAVLPETPVESAPVAEVEPDIEEIAEVAAPLPEPPQISVFRLDPDGEMLVAGASVGAGDWVTQVVLDGRVLAQVEVDGAGQFVTFLSLEASDAPRILSLRLERGDGHVIRSLDEVIIAPTPKVVPEPVVVAAVPDVVPEPVVVAAVPDVVEEAAVEEVVVEEVASELAVVADVVAERPEPTESEPVEAQVVAIVSEIATPEIAQAQPVLDMTPEPEPEPAPEVAQVAVAEVGEVEAKETVVAEPAIAEPVVAEPAIAEPEITQAEAVATPDQTVLLANAEGVEILQYPSGPEVMSHVALDAISYSDAGEVALRGRAGGGGFVRVYLDNTPITTSRIASNGTWRSDLPEVDTGIYTLRIDEVSEDGTVTSRVQTPFKREDTAVLAKVQAKALAASVSAPADEATPEPPRVRVVTVQPGSTLWAISREYYGEGMLFLRVYDANRATIEDPDLIYPGQVFALPE